MAIAKNMTSEKQIQLSNIQNNQINILKTMFFEANIRNVFYMQDQNATRSNATENKQCVGFVKNSRSDLAVTFGDCDTGRAKRIKNQKLHVDKFPRPGCAFVMNKGHVGMVVAVCVSKGEQYTISIVDYNANGPENGSNPTGAKRSADFTIDNEGKILTIANNNPSTGGFLETGSFSFVHETDEVYEGKVKMVKLFMGRLHLFNLLRKVDDDGHDIASKSYHQDKFISRFLLQTNENFSAFLDAIGLYPVILGRGANPVEVPELLDNILIGTTTDTLKMRLMLKKTRQENRVKRTGKY